MYLEATESFEGCLDDEPEGIIGQIGLFYL